MTYKIILGFIAIAMLLSGCARKGISGVYEHNDVAFNVTVTHTWDFREDGTVRYRVFREGEFQQGTYKIEGDTVHITIPGVGSSETERKWNQFRIEGDDLIWLLNDIRIQRK